MSTHSLHNVDRLSQLFFLDSPAPVISDEPDEMGRKLARLPPARASQSNLISRQIKVSDNFYTDPCRVPRIFRGGVRVDNVPIPRREWTDIEGRKTGLLSLSPKDSQRLSHSRPVSLDSGLRFPAPYPGPVRKHSRRDSAPSASPFSSRPILAPIITNFDARRKTYSNPNPKLLPLVNPQPMYPKYLAAAGAPSLTPGPPPPAAAARKFAPKKFVLTNPDPKSAASNSSEWVVVDDTHIPPRAVNPSPLAAVITHKQRSMSSPTLPSPTPLTKNAISPTLVNEDLTLSTPKVIEQPSKPELRPRAETPRPLPNVPLRMDSQVVKAIDNLLEQVNSKPLPLVPRNASNFTVEQERRWSVASTMSTFWSTSSYHSRESTSTEESNRMSNPVDWTEIENFLTKGGKKMEPDVSVQSSRNTKLVSDLLKMRVAQAGLEGSTIRSVESHQHQ